MLLNVVGFLQSGRWEPFASNQGRCHGSSQVSQGPVYTRTPSYRPTLFFFFKLVYLGGYMGPPVTPVTPCGTLA